MNNARRVAAALVALAIPALTGIPPASAAPPPLLPRVCSFVVHGPAFVYTDPRFTSAVVRGKHTGDTVLSTEVCRIFKSGFHSIILSTGENAWMWAGDLVSERPVPGAASRYQITEPVDVLTGPSTSHSAVLTVKHPGDLVASCMGKYEFDNNGYAEILMADGDIGWINSAYVK